MRSSITKLAVAAAIVLAAIGGISLWTGTKSGVALADVLAKVEQVQAFMCKMTVHVKTSMEGMPPTESDIQVTMLGSNEYGMKTEMTTTNPLLGQTMTQETYMLPQQKMIVVLMPSLKQYTRMEVDDATFEKQDEGEQRSPPSAQKDVGLRSTPISARRCSTGWRCRDSRRPTRRIAAASATSMSRSGST